MPAGIPSKVRSFVARWPLTSYGITAIASWLLLVLVPLSVQAFGAMHYDDVSWGRALSLISIILSVYSLPFAPLAVTIETFLPNINPVVGGVLTVGLAMVLCWAGDKTIVRVRDSLPEAEDRRLFLKRWTLILGAVFVFAIGVLFSPVMVAASHQGFGSLASVTLYAGIGFLVGLLLLVASDQRT